MAETWLRFNPGPDVRTFTAPVIEWRDSWEAEWEEAPFTCEEATWSANDGGKVSQATLRKRYGYGREQGGIEFAAILREDTALRKFVRLTFSQGLIEKKWWGVLLDDSQDRFGTRFATDESGTAGTARGVQNIRAHGLEYLLEQTIVTSAWIAKNLDATEAIETKRGLTFNIDGIPNCSDVDDDPDGISRFFHEGVDAIHWTTHEAVRYLLRRNGPKSYDGEIKVPFRLYEPVGGAKILPDFDRPILDTHGRRTKELLDSLISRQRGYGYVIEPNSDESWVELKPFTFVREDVDLDPDDPAKVLPANPSLWKLDLEDRSGSGVRVTSKTTEKFDRIRVLGAYRRSCFTVSFADDTLQNDWKAEDETAYQEGASGAGDYPASAEIEERQRRDEEARNVPKLRDVYAKFRFPEEWDLNAGDGEGGEQNNVLPFELEEVDPATVFLPQVRIERSLPLLAGVDYADGAIEDYAVDHDGERINASEPLLPEIAPFGLLKLVTDEGPPEVARWLPLDTLENFALFPTAATEDVDLRWSADVDPASDVPGFFLNVRGAPQHIIAKDRFSPTNPSAVEPRFDYETFLFTIAIEEDRQCEGKYEVEPPVGSDAAREHVIFAGDDYRLDYVVPQTVVGVDGVTGELIRSEGGYVRDDRSFLKETARLAYEWYKVGRASLDVITGDFEAMLQLPIGSYVESIGKESVPTGNHNQDVESVVTEVRVRCSTGSGNSPPAPQFGFRTDYVELDMRRGGAF